MFVVAFVVTDCAILRPTGVGDVALRPPAGGDAHGEPPRRVALPEGPLTLERALEVALANNPDVAAGAWDVEAARARRKLAEAAHWPSLDVSLGYRHNWNEERLAPPRDQGAEAALTRDIFSADAVLKIPIFSGGRVVSVVAARELLAESAEHRLEQTRCELVFNVKSAFYATLGQEKLIEATEHSAEALDEHLRVTNALLDEQRAAKVDLLNLEVRLSELRYELVKRRGLRDLSTHLLVSLMGVDEAPSERRRELVLAGDLEAREVSLDPSKLFSEALEARPEISAIDGELEAQAKLVDAARAEYWPIVSAQVTYGARLSAQGEADDLGFAGVEVSLPVLAAIGTSARVREERAKLGALQSGGGSSPRTFGGRSTRRSFGSRPRSPRSRRPRAPWPWRERASASSARRPPSGEALPCTSSTLRPRSRARRRAPSRRWSSCTRRSRWSSSPRGACDDLEKTHVDHRGDARPSPLGARRSRLFAG